MDLCSTIQSKRYQRELSIDVAEQRSSLKNKVVVFWLFFKIDLSSASLIESFRRGRLNDLAEHRSILNNSQNTYYPRFVFSPNTGKNSLKQVFRFYSELIDSVISMLSSVADCKSKETELFGRTFECGRPWGTQRHSAAAEPLTP